MSKEPMGSEVDEQAQTEELVEGEAFAEEERADMAEPAIEIQPATFAPLTPSQGNGQSLKDLEFLVDVDLEVSVELGRAEMSLRDVLGLAPGVVIELDKLAGEPVDILVNGKLVGRGEVVVIEEMFGVRVTEIIPPSQRWKYR